MNEMFTYLMNPSENSPGKAQYKNPKKIVNSNIASIVQATKIPLKTIMSKIKHENHHKKIKSTHI